MAKGHKDYRACPETPSCDGDCSLKGDIDFGEIFKSGALRKKIERLSRIIEEKMMGQQGQQGQQEDYKTDSKTERDYKG